MSKYLEVYGANTHNLKNINVKIPKNKMVIITGLSGSGKSSLAFNTIYNVGQQKYLESLSSYARMFIGGMKEEAKVDEIKGLSPTISIDQKTTNRNPRSTVGTITEIYDYYRLLYLNIGERKCIKCNNLIKKDSLENVLEKIKKIKIGDKFIIKALLYKKGEVKDFNKLKKEILDAGFIRFMIGKKIFTVNDDIKKENISKDNIYIIIDRLISKKIDKNAYNYIKRIKDSLELAFKVGKGQIQLEVLGEIPIKKNYSNIFICSNCFYIPEELTISSFSFNSHFGACKSCHGLGVKMVFLEENIINQNLTIEEGAILPMGFGGNYFINLLKKVAEEHSLRLNISYKNLSKEERKLLMYGTGDKLYKVRFLSEKGTVNIYNSKFEGVINILTRRFFNNSKIDKKGHYDKFITEIDCPECNGMRLKKESLNVYFNGLNIGELSNKSIIESIKIFNNIKLSKNHQEIVLKVLKNIKERLEFLKGVGLGYITISRKANTLSGGEAQRIRLATQIGVKLEGIIYVLDEPSIGLHSRDNNMLIDNLKKLKDLGNTLIIVEHDEDIMIKSDYIIDIGPGAGIHGGNIVAEGNIKQIINNKNSVTGPYLSGKKRVIIDKQSRQIKNYLEIIGATQNNLKNINVKIPIGNLTVITGVSGSGKSSLINHILAKYLENKLNKAKQIVGKVKQIKGIQFLDKALIIDQSPIGKTPRSNPATYTGVFTYIREVFAETYDAKLRGYNAGRFSFNTKQGRCNTCDGDGTKKVEMHFLPPVYVKCEDCKGKRFNKETLEIRYKGKTISDILDLTVEEALNFFDNHPKVMKILKVLNKVGLGYIKLGQSSITLSGGEAQRIKLATELSKRSTSKTVYILDEPTTGLHFQDVEKLLKILHGLVDKGNTVIVIEHNMNVILNADYIIDIGPEGGDLGGEIIATGDIEQIKECKKSYTGQAIDKYLNRFKEGLKKSTKEKNNLFC